MGRWGRRKDILKKISFASQIIEQPQPVEKRELPWPFLISPGFTPHGTVEVLLAVMEEVRGNSWVGETGPGTTHTHPRALGLMLGRATTFSPHRDT